MDNKKNRRLLLSVLLFVSLTLVTLVSAATLTSFAPGVVTAGNYTFTSNSSNTSTYFELPSTANVTLARLNITGHSSGNVGFSIEMVNSTGDAGDHNDIAINSSGNAYICYTNSDTLDDLYVMYWDGIKWINQTVDTTGTNQHCNIELNSTNHPRISYIDIAGDDSLMYAYWTGGAWVNENVYDDNDVGLSSDLEINSTGYAKIVFLQDTNDNLMYAEWNGTGWEIQTVASSGGVGYSASLELDSNDYPHISYVYESSLNYTYWNGANWINSSVNASVDAGKGKGCDIVLNSTDSPIIGYMNDDGVIAIEKYNGSGWETNFVEEIFNPITERYIDLEITSNNYEVLAYYGTSNDVAIAEWNGTGYNITDLDQGSHSSNFPIGLAINDNGDQVVSFIEWGGDNLWYAKSEGQYPVGIELDISNDGDKDFKQYTIFNTENETTDFWKELQDYIDNTCATSTCQVPINLTAYSTGTIELSQIYVQYNNTPEINSNVTKPTIPHYGNSTYLYVNATDTESALQSVNFTVRYPNYTLYKATLNQGNATNYTSDFWSSYSFNLSHYGTWFVNITAYDSEGLNDTQNYNFTNNLSTLTVGTNTKNFAQVAGGEELTNVSFSSNGEAYNDIDFYTTGNLSNSTAFFVSFNRDPMTVGDSTEYMVINITSNTSLANGEYTGAVAVNRTNDDYVQYINFTVTMATNAGQLKLSPSFKATSVAAGTALSWTLKVDNDGNRVLENCNATETGDLTAFTTFDKSNFDIAIGAFENVEVQYAGTSAGTKTGTIIINCTATDGGGLDQESVNPITHTVGSSTAPAVGGGGGGGDVKIECNIGVPNKIVVSPAEPVEKITIKNNEEETMVPTLLIQDVNGQTSGASMLSLATEENIILPSAEIDIVISLDTSMYEGNETRYAKLVISSDKCLDIEIPIEIAPTERRNIIDYFTEFGTQLKKYFPFLNTDVFGGINYTHILLASALTMFAVIFIFNKKVRGFGRILIALLGSLAVIIALAYLIKYLVG